MKSKIKILFFSWVLFCPLRPMSAEEPTSVPMETSDQTVIDQNTVAFSARGQEVIELWEAGKKSKARKEIEIWMEKEVKDPEPWVLLARFSFEEKRYKKCLSIASKGITKFPQASEAYYWRGRAYEAMGNYLEAGNEYNAAIHSDQGYQPAQDALDNLNRTLGGSSASTETAIAVESPSE